MTYIMEKGTKTISKLSKLDKQAKAHFQTKLRLEDFFCQENATKVLLRCLKICVLVKKLRNKLLPQKATPKECCYLPESTRKIINFSI